MFSRTHRPPPQARAHIPVTRRLLRPRSRFLLPHPILLLLLSTATVFPQPVHAHGLLDYPNPRGGLNSEVTTKVIALDAPKDYYLHFPAGDKSVVRGSGFRSQVRAASGRWSVFEPMKPGFRWRAGVCGDLRNSRTPWTGDHMIGGKYYWPPSNPMPVATYRPGDILDASIKVVAHHNGYMEFHLCDVAQCAGGDISEGCFTKHCQQLKRAPNPECDNGQSRRCGPIDRNHPGRWYFPCSKNFDDSEWERFGPGTIKYIIPRNVRCERCVLHWYWTAANTCNPPGVIEYFDGEDRPRNWGKCLGQGGALGGVSRVQPPCGNNPTSPRARQRFPEEYYQCADIAVKGSPTSRGSSGVVERGESESESAEKRKSPPRSQPDDGKDDDEKYSTVSDNRRGNRGGLRKIKSTGNRHGSGGLITGLQLVSLSAAMGSVHTGDVVDISGLDGLTFQADTAPSVQIVHFSIHARGRKWTTSETARPFRMYTGQRPSFWMSAKDVNEVVNHPLTIKVLTTSGGGDRDTYRITLTK